MMIAEIFTTQDRFASNAVMSSVNLLGTLFSPFLDRYVSPHPPQVSNLNIINLVSSPTYSTHTSSPHPASSTSSVYQPTPSSQTAIQPHLPRSQLYQNKSKSAKNSYTDSAISSLRAL
jgi:hypothetical protein